VNEPIDASRLFRENELFITGLNGFVGKVVLGLLVGRFPDFKHLHLLVRARPGVSPDERFRKDVLNSPSLKALVDRAPAGIWDRITIHAGDVAEPSFGLKAESLAQMQGRVKAIIHCAGLVEFFPPVDESFRANVDGVENAIAVSKFLGAKLCHISTCFVCGESTGLVEEFDPIAGFYPRRKHPDDRAFDHVAEIQFIRERVADVHRKASRTRNVNAKEVRQQLIDLGMQRAAQWGWVNIYTYSKSLGEQLIVAEPDLDWAIVRPAIVEAALEFPFPGWVEGGRTAAPLIIMAMAGLRHWPLNPDWPLEVVPVDQVAASILTATAHLLSGRRSQVYQIGTADTNPVRLGDLVDWMHAAYREKSPWTRWGSVKIVSAQTAHRRGERLHNRLTSLHDTVAGARKLAQSAGLPGRRALGRLATQLRMLAIQVNIREQTLKLYQPFMLDNRFVFEAESIRRAHAALVPADQTLLPWTPEKIQWKRYWLDHEVKGIQRWVEADMMKGRSFQI
jgi:long-chain acyl-CoA synthetase